MKFGWMRVPAKKVRSALMLSNPDIGPQSSPNAARRDDGISTLETAVAHGGHFRHSWRGKRLLHHLGVMGQERQQPMGKIEIVSDDARERSSQNLGPVLFKGQFCALRLSFWTANSDKSSGVVGSTRLRRHRNLG